MARITIDGKEYELAMTVYAMGQIEEKYGDFKEAMGKFRSGSNIPMVKSMFRIMANAALHAKKQPEDVTGDELDNLDLRGMNGVVTAMRTTMTESARAETVDGGPADDEDHDVYAEERERLEKNGKAGGGSGSGNTTDTP